MKLFRKNVMILGQRAVAIPNFDPAPISQSSQMHKKRSLLGLGIETGPSHFKRSEFSSMEAGSPLLNNNESKSQITIVN